jgi:integrase
VKVDLKGIHKVKRRLAGGGFSVHFYAWRGGPKIEAEPETPAFIAEFQAHSATRDKPLPGKNTMQDLIDAYRSTSKFTSLSPSAKSEYSRYIKRIEAEFGDMPIKAINDPAVRGEFLDWRDKMAAKGARSADYGFAVLSRIMSWAYDRRRIDANPCEKPGRLHSAGRAAAIWSDDAISALIAKASAAVALPCHIALWTGQRQGDVLRLTWSAYDGQCLRIKQSKTGRHLTIPVTEALRVILDAAKAARGQSVTICATSRGTPWTSDGFKTSFGKTCAAAEITGVTFHDFRGTAVMRLAAAGCSVPEIVSITGHRLEDAEAILEKHYFSRERYLGESAIAKLEKHRSGTKV